jgi:hypothetical protein
MRKVYTKEQLRKVFLTGGNAVDECCSKLNTLMQQEACATLGVAPGRLQTSVSLSKRCPDCLQPPEAFEWLFKRSHALKALTHQPPANIYSPNAFKDLDADQTHVAFAPWFWLLMGTRVRNHYMNTYDQHHPDAPFPRSAFQVFAKRAHNCCVKANARHPGGPAVK